jgi:hypothetical protein
MNGPIEGSKGGSRRDFIRGASTITGGAALLGLSMAAEAQVPQPGPAQVPQAGKHRTFRASEPAGEHLKNLGPLAELGGTWVGHGFNVIALPDFQDNATFRVKVNATDENLQFTQIGGNVPNRGSFTPDHKTGQKDINIFGLSYLQRVSDATTSSALHIEPGLWLHVEPSEIPPQPLHTVVRQGSIPHGTSILAQGAVLPTLKNTPPNIQTADITPTNAKTGVKLQGPYLDKFEQAKATLPPQAKPSYIMNPNQALVDVLAAQALANQKITKMDVLDISTDPKDDSNKLMGGGLLNIPFVISNAEATLFSATFWIETVQPATGDPFLQLQYTQTIILKFADINWPHISVATLVKQ